MKETSRNLYIGDALQSPLARQLSRDNVPHLQVGDSILNTTFQKKRYFDSNIHHLTRLQPKVIDLTFRPDELSTIYTRTELRTLCPHNQHRPAVHEHTVLSFLFFHDQHDQSIMHITPERPTEFVIIDPLPFEIALMMKWATMDKQYIEELRNNPSICKTGYPVESIHRSLYNHRLASTYAQDYQ